MSDWLRTEVQGATGLITLNRPQALNALSLDMVRAMTAALLRWREDDAVTAVVVCARSQEGRAVALCAGGDIRFFHQAALAGDPRMEDFFTEEYLLNQLIHRYPKPYVALMDGIVMGGGMGISQGAQLRVVTERSRLAMPETQIGLFPDVGGGHFLSRCAGRLGEYLALTGQVLGAGDAIAANLADTMVPADGMPELLQALVEEPMNDAAHVQAVVAGFARPAPAGGLAPYRAAIDRHFAAQDVAGIVASLAADPSAWAAETLQALRKRSPLMLAVSLAQIRRARALSLEDALRLERQLVRHAFHLRPGAASEAVEGIRALVVDKDHAPRWKPARIEDLDPAEVDAFFVEPWPAHAHPLRHFL